MGSEVFVFIIVGFVLWQAFAHVSRNEQLKRITDFNTRILERIGPGKEFSEFLQTEAGARFMQNLTIDRSSMSGAGAPRYGTRHEIIRVTQAGVVLATSGIGLLLLSATPAATAPGNVAYPQPPATSTFFTLGAIALSIGIGCLLSALASYRLARTLGVLDDVNLKVQ